jgi:hypothetical protein
MSPLVILDQLGWSARWHVGSLASAGAAGEMADPPIHLPVTHGRESHWLLQT